MDRGEIRDDIELILRKSSRVALCVGEPSQKTNLDQVLWFPLVETGWLREGAPHEFSGAMQVLRNLELAEMEL